MLISEEKKRRRTAQAGGKDTVPADATPDDTPTTDVPVRHPVETPRPVISEKARQSLNYWRKKLRRDQEREAQKQKAGILTSLGSIASVAGASSKACGAYVMSSPLALGLGLVGIAVGLYYLVKSIL